jgi:hypothetical protein
MIRQTSTAKNLASPLLSQLNLAADTCPSCGQAIPTDRLEEISGRIAARDREQASALTSKLQEQFATERAKADAEAKADIELEKRKSAEREALAIEKARTEADVELKAKLEEAERLLQDLLAEDKKKLEEAASARQVAEARVSTLQMEMQELRQSSAAELEAFRRETASREVEIIEQSRKEAEGAVAERVARLEADRVVSEADFQERLAQAEAAKSAAVQNEAELVARLDNQRKNSEAEITEIRAAAEADAVRIRQEAVASATAQFQLQIAAKDEAVAEANTKALCAQQELRTFSEQQDHMINERLNSQREILEKDKETAVNVEKANAFEENQKLSAKVNELQRALEKKTSEELGEGAEIDLFEALRAEFPDDDITRFAKGAPGADIRHVVKLRGQECGTIIYDSKNHKAFRSEHVAKLRSDQLAAKAEHAILSLHKFPEGTRQLHQRDGVLLANPARVVALANLLRQHIIQVHTMRLSGIEREKKTVALYDFITSEQYVQLVRRVEERTNDLRKEQEKEVKWHEAHWRREGEALRSIQKAEADIENAVAGILGAASNGTPALTEAS